MSKIVQDLEEMEDTGREKIRDRNLEVVQEPEIAMNLVED